MAMRGPIAVYTIAKRQLGFGRRCEAPVFRAVYMCRGVAVRRAQSVRNKTHYF